ncbi:MAG TPA: hypothetical protein VFV57_05810 [Limnobacter sp.]|nr:hypothetical protein [Limnobacter sp.]
MADLQNWLLRDLIALQTQTPPKKSSFSINPRPPGVPQGETTKAVLAFLQSSGTWHTCAQIIRATGGTHAAVSLSLMRLQRWGSIESQPDSSRNPRYLRYRYIPSKT